MVCVFLEWKAVCGVENAGWKPCLYIAPQSLHPVFTPSLVGGVLLPNTPAHRSWK